MDCGNNTLLHAVVCSSVHMGLVSMFLWTSSPPTLSSPASTMDQYNGLFWKQYTMFIIKSLWVWPIWNRFPCFFTTLQRGDFLVSTDDNQLADQLILSLSPSPWWRGMWVFFVVGFFQINKQNETNREMWISMQFDDRWTWSPYQLIRVRSQFNLQHTQTNFGKLFNKNIVASNSTETVTVMVWNTS